VTTIPSAIASGDRPSSSRAPTKTPGRTGAGIASSELEWIGWTARTSLVAGGRLVACRRSYELLAGGCALGFGFFTLGGRLGVLSPIVEPPMLAGSPVGPPDLCHE
jgi:hypothetical protein